MMQQVRIITIKTGYVGIYLVINTKKPWWKKKDWFYIGPHSETTYDLLGNRIDIDLLYFRYENDKGHNKNKVIPFREYPHFVAG